MLLRTSGRNWSTLASASGMQSSAPSQPWTSSHKHRPSPTEGIKTTSSITVNPVFKSILILYNAKMSFRLFVTSPLNRFCWLWRYFKSRERIQDTVYSENVRFPRDEFWRNGVAGVIMEMENRV